jgi:UDP-N-acetylmuramoyl-tripeptide--D-alanyl-D-alanine ligase
MSDKDVLWHWTEVCEALGLPPAPGPDIHGISIDTRTLQPGDLFVALSGDPGPRFHTASRSDRDGHDFVAAAATCGAVGALTHRPTGARLPELRVADTLDGLWQLGRASRRRLTCPVFAVTGSSGKTTVRSFLAAALGIPQVAGSLNNFWGVPLSLARTPATATGAVFEVGTNHPGEIEPLARLVNPGIALVLNVRSAHLEFFPSFAALQREKFSIYRGLTANGVAVVPDDAPAALLPDDHRLVRFGRSTDADVVLLEYDDAERRARYRVDGIEHWARVPGGGVHRAISLAAVLGCLVGAGLSVENALELPDDVVPAGRGTRREVAGVGLIDDSYNANPASMAAALDGLAGATGRRKVAILGEMLELGGDSPRLHRELADHCREVERIVCVGLGMRALWDALPSAQRWRYQERVDDDLINEVVAGVEAGDVVLVKGSNRVFWQHRFVERLARALRSRETR